MYSSMPSEGEWSERDLAEAQADNRRAAGQVPCEGCGEWLAPDEVVDRDTGGAAFGACCACKCDECVADRVRLVAELRTVRVGLAAALCIVRMSQREHSFPPWMRQVFAESWHEAAYERAAGWP